MARRLEDLITQMVGAALKPQRQQFASRRRRTVELAKALADLQRDIGPSTNQAYQGAAQTQGALAAGFTGAMREGIESDARAAGEELRRLGAPEAQVSEVGGVGRGAADAAYAVGGYIPGQALAREGAGLAAAQNQLPATTLGRGQYDVRAIDREEAELDAQIPKLRQEARSQLIQEELSRAELDLRNRAQALYEAQYGETVRSHKVKERQSARNYNLQVRKHELAMSNAQKEGRQPNAALSKTYGHIVDGNGKPILDANGKRIPVAKSGKGGGISAKEQREMRQEGVKYAVELRGEPMEYEGPMAGVGAGKYIANKPKGPGIIPAKSPGDLPTTNDPRQAKYDSQYDFAGAQRLLMNTYRISKTVATRWLIAAGWPRPRKSKPRPRPIDKPRG